MIKKFLAIIITAPLVFAMGGHDAPKKMDNKKIIKKTSPFLIVGKMPHLMKPIKANWNNKELNLTKEQKEKLEIIRKNTVSTVKKLAKKIKMLEKKIVRNSLQGEPPKKLKEKVDRLAELKAKATMAHIRCIYKTKQILTSKQLDFIYKNR